MWRWFIDLLQVPCDFEWAVVSVDMPTLCTLRLRLTTKIDRTPPDRKMKIRGVLAPTASVCELPRSLEIENFVNRQIADQRAGQAGVAHGTPKQLPEKSVRRPTTNRVQVSVRRAGNPGRRTTAQRAFHVVEHERGWGYREHLVALLAKIIVAVSVQEFVRFKPFGLDQSAFRVALRWGLQGHVKSPCRRRCVFPRRQYRYGA